MPSRSYFILTEILGETAMHNTMETTSQSGTVDTGGNRGHCSGSLERRGLALRELLKTP